MTYTDEPSEAWKSQYQTSVAIHRIADDLLELTNDYVREFGEVPEFEQLYSIIQQLTDVANSVIKADN